MEASSAGKDEIVDLIINANADVDIQDDVSSAFSRRIMHFYDGKHSNSLTV
jgi:hypothetical protein